MKFLSALALVSTLAFAAPKPLFQSPPITAQTPGHSVDIDVKLNGSRLLVLVVHPTSDGFTADWADWAEPRLLMARGPQLRLTDLKWKSADSGWGKVNVNANADGGPLRCAGKAITFGIGCSSPSTICYELPEGAIGFKARGALDEGGTQQRIGTSVVFQVYDQVPDKLLLADVTPAAQMLPLPPPLYASPVITAATPGHGVIIDVDVSASKELYLAVSDSGDTFQGDWADWVEPRLIMADGSERSLTDINWKFALSGWEKVRINSSVGGKPMRHLGKVIPRGLGTHASSIIIYDLPVGAKRFKAQAVLDDGGTSQKGLHPSVTFQVYDRDPLTIVRSAQR